MAKDEVVVRLLQVFRLYGYEGATLTKISEATGLGRASLYHYFPGGKADMAIAVLAHIQHWCEANVLATLRGQGTPIDRLQTMSQQVNQSYAGGRQACLLAVLSLGESKDLFSSQIKTALTEWIEAIAQVLVEAGVGTPLAKQRAEDAILQIQGALILARALDDTAPFQRILQRLPDELLKPS